MTPNSISAQPAALPLALQLCPFAPGLEAGLHERLECLRWFELTQAERDAALATRGNEVRLVVTGGHLGCPPDLMRALPALELVAINGVGFDKVDLALARANGVAVSNTPGVLTEDVADLAVGLVIAALRGISVGDALVRSGKWPEGELPLGRKVSGLRYGIIGLGRIGSAIAARLAPFGEVGYSSPSAKDVPFRHEPDPADLARWADVLIVACAANAQTEGLVDAQMLEALGEGGWLINVARGSIVDEPALIHALAQGTIAGAALDVFADEPHVPQALRQASNTLLTPHVGSATGETRAEMARLVLANIDALLAGRSLETPVT